MSNAETELKNMLKESFIKIPEKDYLMMKTEVTQKLYESIMGENPSMEKGENNPVERVSWYDSIYFCNKLSEKLGLTPVYSVDGETDVSKWDYTPHQKISIGQKKIEQNTDASGFRLPTYDEWTYAAKGGENYKFAGSDKICEVAWCEYNSDETTHPVAQKKPNGYGLYDMCGNVNEWVFDFYGREHRYRCGGSCDDEADYCKLDVEDFSSAQLRYPSIGIRLVCSPSAFE